MPIRIAMVVYLAVIPVNPETYGVLLYSFWWTALWPMLIAGWKTDSNRWRVPLLIFAGLSSVAAAGQFVVFLVDGVVHRSRSRLWCAATLAGCLVVQIVAYFGSSRPPSSSIPDTIQQTFITPVDYVVRPLATWTATGRGLLGVVFAVVVGLMIWFVKDAEIRWAAFLIALSAVWFTALSAIPAAPDSDPVTNGPRYFFLPFAAFGLLLLLLISVVRRQRVIGAVATVALFLALLGTRDTFVRRTDHLNWADELERCAASTEQSYRLPDHFDGKVPTPWYLPLDPSFCRSVVGS
jgi:peptidoglycan/LPS O-acetylase OafA/YrhL